MDTESLARLSLIDILAREKRKMPSKSKIVYHWKDQLKDRYDWEVDTESCFACGSNGNGRLDRAHIVPRSISFDDSVENIHLLCPHCHLESESFIAGDWHYWHWFDAIMTGKMTPSSVIAERNREKVFFDLLAIDPDRTKSACNAYLKKKQMPLLS